MVSRTIFAASITSFPTPSPGNHAILYFDMKKCNQKTCIKGFQSIIFYLAKNF
jgi:hypothetical protein